MSCNHRGPIIDQKTKDINKDLASDRAKSRSTNRLALMGPCTEACDFFHDLITKELTNNSYELQGSSSESREERLLLVYAFFRFEKHFPKEICRLIARFAACGTTPRLRETQFHSELLYFSEFRISRIHSHLTECKKILHLFEETDFLTFLFFDFADDLENAEWAFQNLRFLSRWLILVFFGMAKHSETADRIKVELKAFYGWKETIYFAKSKDELKKTVQKLQNNNLITPPPGRNLGGI
jgi:hypothetical protein